MARRFQRSRISAKRGTVWFSIAAVSTNLGGASTAALISSFNAAALAFVPFTVVRTHLFFHLRSDQVAATELYQAAIAMAVVTAQAAAAGVASVPTPFTDLGSDAFYLHATQGGRLNFSDGTGILELGKDMQVDSKAMRKVEEGSNVILVAETSSLSAGVDMITSGRMLVKVH